MAVKSAIVSYSYSKSTVAIPIIIGFCVLMICHSAHAAENSDFKIKGIEDYLGITNWHTLPVEPLPPAAREVREKKKSHTSNPHGNPALCIDCHTSSGGGKTALRFDGNASQLCRSCHDGELAESEAHPSDIIPSAEIAKKIPSDLPLYNGTLTCLSCHDVVQQCTAEKNTAAASNILRGTQSPSGNLPFCFRCHVRENYQPLNVHDQLDAGKLKTDICLWCHVHTPKVSPAIQESGLYALRGTSHGLCNNCHRIDLWHPANGAHISSVPLPDMLAYMYAYEIQSQMSMPLRQLTGYVRAMKKSPRSIPLDQNGGVTCYSCHNPHEKDLFPKSNLRAIGAEPKHAVNYRLRTRENNICKACHDKEITQ